MKTLLRGCLALSTLLLSLSSIAAPFKVGFVYISPVGEAGWSYSHDKARKELEARFKGQVETKAIENVGPGDQTYAALNQLIEEQYDLIFTTSWDHMIPTNRTARENPQVQFEQINGIRWRKNLSTLSPRTWESRYLSGIVAGEMSKSGKIGYVAAYPIAEVIRELNAFTLGVRSVNPKATVEVQWTWSWFDPAKERESTGALIDNGADIIAQHTDSPTPVEVAEARGVYAIGYHSDMSKFGPKAQLTAVIHDWTNAYSQRIEQAMQKRWKSGDNWVGVSDGTSSLAPFNVVVPKDLISRVERVKNAITNGEKVIFEGPINNSTGKQTVRPGKVLKNDDLMRMNWYVEGVTGDLQRF